MTKRALRFSLASALVLVTCGASGPAVAGDTPAAQSLFYEARTLMQRGRYAEACPKLEESQRLDSGIGTQFNLADCYEHVGRVATAWAGFLDVAAQSKASGQVERERVARRRAQVLERRLPKLVIQVEAPTPGLQVRRDEVMVGEAALGTAVPVDPGPHTVKASLGNKLPWTTTVRAVEGKTVTVIIPRDTPLVATSPLAPMPIAPPNETAQPSAPAQTTAAIFPPTYSDEHDSVPAQRIVGYGVGVAGLVGLGVGGAYGLKSLLDRNESRSHCAGDVCDTQGVGLRDDALRNGNIATVTTIAGGVLVVGGIVLLATAPSKSERTASVRAAPSVGRDGGGIVVVGALP